MYTVTGAARRCARSASKRMGIPSGRRSSGRPYRSRALLLVTSGGLFMIVALGPAKCARRGRRREVEPSAAIRPSLSLVDQRLWTLGAGRLGMIRVKIAAYRLVGVDCHNGRYGHGTLGI